MRILAVSPHLPHPQIPHAGGQFLYRRLELLARSHEVSLSVPGSPEVRRATDEIPSWLEVTVGPPTSVRGGLIETWRDRFRRRARFGALYAPHLASLRRSGLFERASEADVVELHWMEVALLAPELRRAGVDSVVSIVAHDLLSEAVPGRRETGAVAARWTDALRARSERRDLAAADAVLVFKEQDAARLRARGGSTRVQVLDPWIDAPSAGNGRSRGTTVLFTGAMWRPENQDGISWFLRLVWPEVRRAVPQARLQVVGSTPPDWLVDLANDLGGVEVTGFVPSLAPYYAAAAVFVAPLFVPGGLKFKVPQAMTCGLPVIATPVAAAGVVEVAPPGALWSVTDDASSMAGAVVDALRRPADASAVGDAAARWARVQYSFDRSTAQTVDLYRSLLGERISRRPGR